MNKDRETEVIDALAEAYGKFFANWFRGAARSIVETGDHLGLDRFVRFDCLSPESPIERLMAIGLLFAAADAYRGEGINIGFKRGGDYELLRQRTESDHDETFDIWHQAKVGSYTADFLVRHISFRGEEVWAVIECDGHQFHERTPKQASHDKARDRYFQSRDILVLRYPGSDIYRSPESSAISALKLIEGVALARFEARRDRALIKKFEGLLPPDGDFIAQVGSATYRFYRDEAGDFQVEPVKAG